jgi:hypothetical protein
MGDVRLNAETATDTRTTVSLFRRLTPTAASHTYSIRGYTNTGSSVTVDGGAGTSGVIMPQFIRQTKV